MKSLIIVVIIFICHFYLEGQNSSVSISCPNDTIVCLFSENFALSGGIPSGGKYSGTGVIFEGTAFSPLGAQIGQHLITYTVNNDSCTFYITVIDKPEKGIINSTDTSICLDDVRTYCIEPIEYATKYIWNLTNSPLTNVPTIQPCIEISFTNGYASGELTVMAVNKCDSSVSDPLHITVKPNPEPFIKNLSDTLSSQDSTCKNQRATYYSINEFASYFWSVQNGTKVGPDNTRTFVVSWDNSGTGIVKLTVVKNDCQGSTSRNVIVSEESAPIPSTIWLFGFNMLVCSDSNATSYQWYKNEESIPNATGSYYIADPAYSGNYYVKTCTGSCCNFSNPFNFFTGIREMDQGFIKLFPNPADASLHIQLAGQPGPYCLRIFNQTGAEAKKICDNKSELVLNITELADGLYFIDYYSVTNGHFTAKFIKYSNR